MRDGIYRVEFRSGQTIGKGIAVADNDTIRGFDETYFISLATWQSMEDPSDVSSP